MSQVLSKAKEWLNFSKSQNFDPELESVIRKHMQLHLRFCLGCVIAMFLTAICLMISSAFLGAESVSMDDVYMRMKVAPLMLGLWRFTFDQFNGEKEPQWWVWILVYLVFVIGPIEVCIRSTVVSVAIVLSFCTQTLNLLIKTSMCSKGQRIVAVLGTYLYIVYRITHLDRSPTYIVFQMKDFLPTTDLP